MPELLIDKALPSGHDIAITESGDMKAIEGDSVHLQTAQNRCLSIFSSWIHDLQFGSTLYEYLNSHSVWQLTDEIVRRHVERALQPMLEDGRIQELVNVRIVERDTDSLLLEVIVDLGIQLGTITYEIIF